MKNKGFTLIELLAVIIILAVIALIATPIVLNVINEAKLNAAKSSAYGYLDAIKLNYAEGIMDNDLKLNIPEDGVLERGVDDEELNKIKTSGNMPDYIYLEFDGSRVSKGSFCIDGYSIDYDGTKATESLNDYCNIVVTEKLVLNNTENVLVTGDTLQLSYEIEPADLVPRFSSSDESIATVDENGLVTAHALGDVVITVTSGGKTVSLNLAIESINDSIIGYVKRTNFTHNTVTNIEVKAKGVKYSAHVYTYDGDQVWDNKIFGSDSDVGTASANAKNMVVVKVNGNLTINSGATITAHSYTDGSGYSYGGPKGLFIYVTGDIINNGTITMSKKGAKAVGENVYLWDNGNGYEYVPATGGVGGAGLKGVTVGNDGKPSTTKRGTGGGGSGAPYNGANLKSSSGGTGTSYSGGAGGTGADYTTPTDGSSTGGAGGLNNASNIGCGAGNPSGASAYKCIKGNNGTGGLLIIYGNSITNNGTLSADGTTGGYAFMSGGSSGGGSINVFYSSNYTNTSTAKVTYAGGGATGPNLKSGAGGSGSVTYTKIDTE